MYYQTTKLTAEQHKEYSEKAETQKARILAWFRSTREKFTPFEVQAAILPDAPITSIRRAITDLTKEGLLTKLEAQKCEVYGHTNHLWVISFSCLQG